MVKINENFLTMKKNYLFIDIAKRLKAFTAANPDKPLIRMGIGDVTLPLAPVVVEAIKKAADEMGVKETFRGYEDSGTGYDFLKEAIAGYYKSFGVSLELSEIRVNDGAKADCGNITDIFGDGNTILVTDPAYPVYVDSNVMAGRDVIYADSNEENGFAAMPDENVHADIIYLCSPNNPTGSVYTKAQLKEWVDYALKNEAVIIFDSAYEAFISDPELPRSIYAVEGAKKCAIEMCSLSKTAGFTGTRCGYTIIPEELIVKASDGTDVSLAQIWGRRQGSKFNGVSYPIQRGAEAVFTPEGQKQTHEAIDYYRRNAKVMADALTELGIKFTGGINSPYIWLKCPNNMGSWEFFDYLLNNIQVVGTPGEGFGKNGAGWFRLTAFGTYENTVEAMRRLKELLK
ncbi:MAG: LL-diaminopimelate aminotransferase [Oscillospiraceae bacterium]|nr:LL-diaminopimelate aminotransferase [Oscillospiraceae bacterium]MCI7498387.1 LL-diaminopimelate aminotransferase [Oscillospiraceae bacterium]MDD7278157.1 LL-diaminopimelate aminotransferase [Oscillospiraceae bacterium]MDY2864828.1 LL-diaminopimelate aminotransferase [Oscillospiraceae bacterium]